MKIFFNSSRILKIPSLAGGKWPMAGRRGIFLILFYSILAAALIAPISSDQAIPAITDYANHIASIIEAKMGLAEGQFPLRIAPTELFGWRYPNFQFYSPTTYTLAGLIYQWLTPKNPITAINITIWLALLMGGLFMQRLAFWFVKSRPAALLAGIVYLTTPYYVVVITGLGNMCEAMALGIMPAVIYYSLQRYLHPHDHKTLLQTGLAWYLLITIHLVTFIYTALFTALLLALITFKNRRHWKNLIAAGIGIAFGCLLAMWFLAPIALLQKYLIINQTFVNPARFQSFAPTLSNLLFPGRLSFQGPLGNNHVAIGWPILMAVGISVYALSNQSRLSNVRANYWLPALLLLFFLAFITIWSPIQFLQWAPSALLIGQYCWRLLDQLIWIGTLIFAWAVCWLFKNTLDLKKTVIGILLLIITASATFPTLFSGNLNIDLKEFIKQPYLLFNPDAYTIQFNKQTGFIDKIDTLELSSLMIDNTLQLNSVYVLPQTLLHYNKAPRIMMKGTIPDTIEKGTRLKAIINHSTLATFNLIPGKLHWEIPINLNQFKTAKSLELQFKSNNEKKTTISINELSLTGFLSSPDTLNVKTVQPFCQQKNTITVCKINVPKETKLVELPILYYPQLLHITLNGHAITYKGIVYQNNLITGIKPEASQLNFITIEFTGLSWANTISRLSWMLWFGLLFLILKKVFRQGKSKKLHSEIL